MSSNSDSSANTDDTTLDSNGAWLLDQYGMIGAPPGLPSAYTKFRVDSPNLIRALQEDLATMSAVRTRACYQSVQDTMTDVLGTPPIFEPKNAAPQFQTDTARQDAHLTSFFIGHELDVQMVPTDGRHVSRETQIILDAAVIGVVESPVGTVDETVTWVRPDLLTYDYLTVCQAVDGTIYSGTVSGDMTEDRVKGHVMGELGTRRRLLLENSSIYKSIYTPAIDSLLNEHYQPDH